MNNVTLNLEGQFKQFANNLSWVMGEASDIYSAYFATNASTLVNALPNATDAASLATKLTKGQYTNAIGFLEQLNKFFNNQAVTQGDYLNPINNAIYGAAVTPTQLSEATESLANRINTLAQAAKTHYLTANDILDLYNNSNLSVLVAEAPATLEVFGASMTVTQLIQGITLVEQYKKLINNEAVATGDYSVNIAIWKMM